MKRAALGKSSSGLIRPRAESVIAAAISLEQAMTEVSREAGNTRLSWHTVEEALAVAREYRERRRTAEAFVWASLAVAALRGVVSNHQGPRARLASLLFEKSGHRRRLEGYAFLIRGVTAMDLGHAEDAEEDLARAKGLMAGVRAAALELEATEAYIRQLQEPP